MSIACRGKKKHFFSHWNFTEHTNLTYARNGPNNVNSVVFLETFFSSLFEFFFLPLLLFCICVMVSDFAFLSACVCVSAYACISFLGFIFSFLKSEKRKIWG